MELDSNFTPNKKLKNEFHNIFSKSIYIPFSEMRVYNFNSWEELKITILVFNTKFTLIPNIKQEFNKIQVETMEQADLYCKLYLKFPLSLVFNYHKKELLIYPFEDIKKEIESL